VRVLMRISVHHSVDTVWTGANSKSPAGLLSGTVWGLNPKPHLAVTELTLPCRQRTVPLHVISGAILPILPELDRRCGNTLTVRVYTHTALPGADCAPFA
jgi:hypothetical protein